MMDGGLLSLLFSSAGFRIGASCKKNLGHLQLHIVVIIGYWGGAACRNVNAVMVSIDTHIELISVAPAQRSER
jgi:hypothetical protein